MESKLDFILAALESEEKAIKASIDEFLEEGDYEFAFLQSKGLSDISHQIYLLKRIEDPLFKQKQFLQTRIQNIEKALSKQVPAHLKEYLLNELQAAERELEIFEMRQKEDFLKPKETVLDNCLQLLFLKKIKAVDIIFSKKTNLCSKLTLRGKTLSIRISSLKNALQEGCLDNYHIKMAEKLGFSRLSRSLDLKLKLQGEQDDLMRKSKFILARLTFDIFPGGCIDSESFIKLTQ